MANNQGDRSRAVDKHVVEVMKQMLSPFMSENNEAVPELSKEAGGSSCCIFKVPHEACWPRVVSIGPYHNGKPQLRTFEERKWRYLCTMLDRLQPHDIHLENLINTVAPKQKMIRQCYSASTKHFSDHDFVIMMVLDGCFIIEFLRQITLYIQSDDFLSNNPYMYLSLVQDLLRLENQVPFFVLEDLFAITNVSTEITSLTILVLKFFDGIVERPVRFLESHGKLRGVHLLDLLHLNLITGHRHNIGPAEKISSDKLISSASKLNQAGIAIVQKEASTFLEIKFDFKRGILEIPKLTINDNLRCILHNIVAFERCFVYRDKHFTAYALFMGSLIDKADDAQLLCDRGVMWHNGLSKEGVASFFRDVCKDAHCDLSKSHLGSEIARVNRYVGNQQVRILFMQIVYAFCHSAWTAIASVVMLTGVIQTVYTVLQFYRSR